MAQHAYMMGPPRAPPAPTASATGRRVAREFGILEPLGRRVDKYKILARGLCLGRRRPADRAGTGVNGREPDATGSLESNARSRRCASRDPSPAILIVGSLSGRPRETQRARSPRPSIDLDLGARWAR